MKTILAIWEMVLTRNRIECLHKHNGATQWSASNINKQPNTIATNTKSEVNTTQQAEMWKNGIKFGECFEDSPNQLVF
jgi:hypothetical protein